MISFRALTAVAAVVLVAVAGCGGDDDADDGDVVITDPAAGDVVDSDAISLGDLLDREEQGRPGDNVLVITVILEDGAGMRMCEALAESFPPQCGGRSIGIRNPNAVDVEFTEAEGVRWTDGSVELLGWVEDGQFVVT